MKNYQVIVGNIGTVYDDTDLKAAQAVFDEYVEQSRNNYGRASGEDVTMLCDDEEYAIHVGRKIVPYYEWGPEGT